MATVCTWFGLFHIESFLIEGLGLHILGPLKIPYMPTTTAPGRVPCYCLFPYLSACYSLIPTHAGGFMRKRIHKYILNKEMNYWIHRLHKDVQNNHILSRPPTVGDQSISCINWRATEEVEAVPGGKGLERQRMLSTIKQFARSGVRQNVAADSQLKESICYVNI